MIVEPIHKFIKYYYIPVIDKLVLHLAHVYILGKNECVEIRKYALISYQKYVDIREIRYYAEK